MADELAFIGQALALGGIPANRPPPGGTPLADQPGAFFFPTDGSQPSFTSYTGVGTTLAWFLLGGGGGGTTVAGGPGIIVAGGPAYTVSLGFPLQQRGDLPYFDGTNWVRFPIGVADGLVPQVVNVGPDRDLVYLGFTADAPIVATWSGGWNHSFSFPAQVAGSVALSFGGPGTPWGVLSPGVEGSRFTVNSGFPLWMPNGTPLNVDIYVAGLTGNNANDGTIGSPVQTLNRAMELVSEQPTGYAVIHCATNEPITETVLWAWQLPSGKGPQSKVVTIDAAPIGVIASQAITAGLQGLGSAFGNVQVPGPLVPQAHRGQILHYQTGLNAGYYRISANGAGDIQICGSFPFGPAPGDTVEILTEGVTVTLPAPGAPTDQVVLSGSGLCFSGINLELNGNLLVAQAGVLLNCSSLRDAGTIVVAPPGQLAGPFVPLMGPTTLPPSPRCGPHLACDIIATEGGRLYLNNFLQDRPISVQKSSSGILQDVQADGEASIQVGYNSDCQVGPVRCKVTVATASAVITYLNNSSGQVSAVDFGETGFPPPSDGLRVQNGSQVDAFQLTCSDGPVGGQYGVYCATHSRVTAADANVGTTVVGTAGAAQVGNNAAPSTWAQIAGGLAANCLDTAATFPTYAMVNS